MNPDNYIQINHAPLIKLYDNTTFTESKTNLFINLSSKDNDCFFCDDINKLLSDIMKLNYHTIASEDKLDIIYRLINIYYQLAGFNINDQDLCNAICKKLAKEDLHGEFSFTTEHIESLGKVLSFGFINMQINQSQSNPNPKSKSKSKSKLKKSLDYPSFIELTKTIRYDNIDIIKDYFNESIDRRNHKMMILSSELILLMNIFDTIKSLKISFDNCLTQTSLIAYTLIILNYEWLFNSIFSVSLDMTCPMIHKDFLGIYKAQLDIIYKLPLSLSSSYEDDTEFNETSIWKKILFDSQGDLIEMIQKQKVFNVIVLYSYYISAFNCLCHLEVIFPDSFRNEIYYSLQRSMVNVHKSYHFLQLYLPFNKLISLSLEFNCFEKYTCGMIFNVINNNINLKHLSLGLFAKGDANYFSSMSLLKIAIIEGINLLSSSSLSSSSSTSQSKDSMSSLYFNETTIVTHPKFLSSFEHNMESLFILLLTKRTIESITFNFNIPIVLYDNEQYYFTLLKFIFNLFKMLNMESKPLTQFKLIAPMMPLDNRRYPLIEKSFEDINLYDKNKQMILMHMQFYMNSLVNVTNVISIHLQCLFLGDMDLDVLQSFILFYQSEGFNERSYLNYVTISLCSTLFDYSLYKEDLKGLYRGRHPKMIRRFGMECYSVITVNEIEELIELGNGNDIDKYYFKIKGGGHEDYSVFDKDERFEYEKDERKRKEVLSIVLINMKIYGTSIIERLRQMLGDRFLIKKRKRTKKVVIQFK